MQRMKKFLHIGLIAMIAVAVIALAGCNQVELEKIEIEGYRQDFFAGDTFETGSDFAVYAIYSDGNRQKIEDGYTVKQETGMDMNVVGDYMIIVEYEGKKADYKIYVNEADSTLTKLTLDMTSVKTDYQLGDSFDFSGIHLTATYLNASGRTIEMTYDKLNDFTVTVTDEEGNVVEDAFVSFGKHKITISSGDISTSYEVNVEGVNLDTVGNAIYAAQYGFRFVNAGTLVKTDTIAASKSVNYEYAFGDNYTYIKAMSESDAYGLGVSENHYSIDPDTGMLINAYLENGSLVNGSTYVTQAMNGVAMGLWWQADTEYGMEAVIANLYKKGYSNSNGDYVETVDKEKRTYSFSYSYRMVRTTGVEGDDYFFVNTVTFTLDESYALKNAKVTQILYTHGFSEDENGHTGLDNGATMAHKLELEMEQTVGEKTAQNPYGKDSLVIQDFQMKYDGDVLNDGDTIIGKAGDSLTIRIDGIIPETSSLEYDMPYFSDGEKTADPTIFLCNGYTVYRSGNVIKITLVGGGDWDLVISTKEVTKTVKFSVTGKAPTELNTQVYRPAFNTFVDAETAISMVEKPLYFLATPDSYANGVYSVKLVEGDETAVLEKTAVNGVECWALTASEVGTYKIRMTSDVAPDVTCELTVNVVDVPDMSQMLVGTYCAQDNEDGVYKVTFTQTAGAALTSGTVEIVYTKADGSSQNETLKFAVADGDLNLLLEPESSLGVDIKVNAKGQLVLEDLYGSTYILTAETK